MKTERKILILHSDHLPAFSYLESLNDQWIKYIKSVYTQNRTTMLLLVLLSHFSHVRLFDPIDGSPPGSPVPGIFQARTLEWVAISFSNAWKWKVKVKSLSRIWLLATPWTAVYQAPPSMGFSRQEYWSGVPLPSPRTTKGPRNSTPEYISPPKRKKH